MKPVSNFSIYHQCYKNKKATEFAIQQFRLHNPDIPYYLLSDGGEDFSEIASKYNCDFVLAPENIGTNYLENDAAKIYLQRLRSAFEYSKTEYLLTMEDDVLCRGSITIEGGFNLAMSYVPGNKIVSHIFEKVVRKYNNNPNVDWYGATGGSILNKNIFFDDEKLKIVDQFMKEDFESSVGSIDQFVVILYLICGLDCSINNGLGETHRTPNWQNTNLPLIHCYKEMY
jgi:hypothetical protein